MVKEERKKEKESVGTSKRKERPLQVLMKKKIFSVFTSLIPFTYHARAAFHPFFHSAVTLIYVWSKHHVAVDSDEGLWYNKTC